MATIKDVAKEAGVAISTVSNVLNQVDVVSPETRERVQDAVRKLNYMPNLNGRFLKKTETGILGLFITSPNGPFYNALISAMYERCCEKNYGLTIFLNHEKNLKDSYQAILGKRVDGAIILNETIREVHIEKFRTLEMPVIFLDREVQSETIGSVVIDNYGGMQQIMKYLLFLGHRKFLYLHGTQGNYDEITRYRGYRDTLRVSGTEPDPGWELYGAFSRRDAYLQMRRWLKEGRELPDALVAANDEMAIGCMEALQEDEIRVPGKVSIVGFDNIERGSYVSPRLTTMDSETEKLGKEAVDRLIAIVAKKGRGEISTIPGKMMIRESCGRKVPGS